MAMKFYIILFLLYPLKNNALLRLLEGDACVVIHANNSLEPGQCRLIEKCNYARTLLEERKIPQTCGFDKNIPLVCCPSVNENEELLFNSKSEEKCFEYYNPRVVGVAHGQRAVLREFPHMAAIGYGSNKNNVEWLCGGTLISEEFVLTAAHCVATTNFGAPKWTRLGDLDLNNTSEGAIPQDISVNRTYIHPSYNPRFHYNDIALLKLQKPVSFNSYIQPACLQIKKELDRNKLEAVGWGSTSYAGERSSHLLKASLNVISFEKCFQEYDKISSRRLNRGIVDDIQICAGSDSGKDTCSGDSGGPLHYLKFGKAKLRDHFVVVGVTSFGKACGVGSTFGVYTRVSSHVKWIESVVWPSE